MKLIKEAFNLGAHSSRELNFMTIIVGDMATCRQTWHWWSNRDAQRERKKKEQTN